MEDNGSTYQSEQSNEPANEEIIKQDEQLQHFLFIISKDTTDHKESEENYDLRDYEGSPHFAMIDDGLMKGKESGTNKEAQEQYRMEGFLWKLL